MFGIFGKLGGEEAALEIIANRSGVKPSAEAVRGWRRMGRIPGNKAVYLIDECNKRGIFASWESDCIAIKAHDDAFQEAAQ